MEQNKNQSRQEVKSGEAIKAIHDKLKECMYPQNIECDGVACQGCWKDIVREAMEMLEQLRYSLPTQSGLNTVDVEKLADEFAKKFCGIKQTIDMNSFDEAYYNPKYREYIACVTGFLNGQALQSNTGLNKEEIIKWIDERPEYAGELYDRAINDFRAFILSLPVKGKSEEETAIGFALWAVSNYQREGGQWTNYEGMPNEGYFNTSELYAKYITASSEEETKTEKL